MLKGKTTIQLFDANTGELTDEVSSENMVTNAVKNALGGIYNQLASGDNWSRGMYSLEGIYKLPADKNFAQALYGGVLVFSKAIKEDVNHCLPTIEEIKYCIGCGNQSASNTGNSFRGSINSAESVIGADYAKFVWDFNTDQCNGDIASICLTSDRGGAVGYGCDSKSVNLAGLGFCNLRQSCFWDLSNDELTYNYPGALYNAKGWNSNEGKCAYIDGDYLHVIFRGSDTKQSIDKLTSKAKFGIGLVDGFNYGSNPTTETIDSGVAVYRDIDCTNTKGYSFCQDGDISKTEMKLVKYSGNGVASRITIPVQNINSAIANYYGASGVSNYLNSKSKVIHNDKVYFMTGNFNQADLATYPNKLRVWVLSFDGTYTYKDVNVNDKFVSLFAGTAQLGKYADGDLGGKFFKYRGSLCYVTKDDTNGHACFLIDDDGTMETKAIMFMKSDYLFTLAGYDTDIFAHSPWIENIMHVNSSDFHLYVPLLVSAYLGTINNQETVLTKTADKTMKIIYTLTQSWEV